METNAYIVVAFYNGMAHFLQYKNVLNWHFSNNGIKMFKTKQAAIKNAHKVLNKFKVSSVKVYQITPETYLSCSNFHEDDVNHVYMVSSI